MKQGFTSPASIARCITTAGNQIGTGTGVTVQVAKTTGCVRLKQKGLTAITAVTKGLTGARQGVQVSAEEDVESAGTAVVTWNAIDGFTSATEVERFITRVIDT
jgi:hypothetical protein